MDKLPQPGPQLNQIPGYRGPQLSKQQYKILALLNDRWRLTRDKNQWIVERREGSQWRGIHFIGDRKASLIRVLDENDIYPTDAARRELAGLPDRFVVRRK